MFSKDDSYVFPKKRCLLINGKKLHVVDVDTLNIDEYNNVHIKENKVVIDKEAFILMKNRSVIPKYLHTSGNFVTTSMDDTVCVTSYYSIYKSNMFDTKIFTVSFGHLGYSEYLRSDLGEGGFSQITYYKNTGLIKKKYIDTDGYSSDDFDEYSSPSETTRSSKTYKNDIKFRKDPEQDTKQEDTLDEVSYDMIKEIALFEYVKEHTNISRYITEMYHIDLKNSEIYFPKYTELKYKNRHFKPKKHFYQLIYTLYVLHKHGIMHGDLKPSNLYIDKRTGDIKIGDWGLMQIDRTDDWSAKKTKGIQTQSYKAPEVHFTGKYTYKADIWSLGLMLLEASIKTRLTSGSETYSDVIEMLDKILCFKVKEECKKDTINGKAFLKFKKKYKDTGKDLIKLVHKMMSPNDKLRPTYEEILSSPYFEEFKFQPISLQKKQVKFRSFDTIKYVADELALNEDIFRNSCILNSRYCLISPTPPDIYTQFASLLLSCKLFHKKLSSIYSFVEDTIDTDKLKYLDMCTTIDTVMAREIEIIESLKYKLLY